MKDVTAYYATALYEVTKNETGSSLTETLSEFANLLRHKNLLYLADSIIAAYIVHAEAAEGITRLAVTSARKLDEKSLQLIKKIFGEKANLKEKVDKKLIGGVKIQTADTIFDATVKKQVDKLKHVMSA